VLEAGDEIVLGSATIVVGIASAVARRSRVVEAEMFEDRLAAEIDRATRYQRPVAVAALHLVGDDAVIDAVAGAIRAMDLVGDYGGDDYALLLPELSREAAEAAVRQLIGEARMFATEARAGIAMIPDDGLSVDELLERSRAALRRARTADEPVAATPPPPPPIRDDDRIIVDPAMRRIYSIVDRIAASNLTVLVLGETGVGKEIVAEAIHRASSRRNGPLVKLNCASLPESLLETELFGHERGAFTGADRKKVGYFEAASGGTLFLDEIGEMHPALQAKLLRVLERKVVIRVGGTDEIPVDVRVVAATHRDVEAEVRAGRFREDLYFRIAGFTVAVPPLRDRTSEIVPLAEHFLRQAAGELEKPVPSLREDATAALRCYDWPGNVRELKNAIERAVAICTDRTVTPLDLPERVLDAGRRCAPPQPSDGSMREQLAEIERAAIVDALAQTGGNQTRAAQRLGVSRRTLIYKLEKLGLKPPPRR
jgi:DNA-binding NtrC family response regulator